MEFLDAIEMYKVRSKGYFFGAFKEEKNINLKFNNIDILLL